ncbi:membrane hypothetical protein [Gammaproteobacteria bacterium]
MSIKKISCYPVITKIMLATLLIFFSVLAFFDHPTKFYPIIEFDVGVAEKDGGKFIDIIKLNLIFEPKKTQQNCEGLVGKIAAIFLSQFAGSTVRTLKCLRNLETDQKLIFSEQPLSTPSSWMNNGVVVYSANNPNFAMATCEKNKIRFLGNPGSVKCYAPGTPRIKPITQAISINQILLSLIICFIAAFTSWFICWLIIKYEHLHARFSYDHVNSGPQKFHSVPTPRIGGIGIITGLIAALAIVILASSEIFPFLVFKRYSTFDYRDFIFLLIASVPAFLGGLIEDITKKVGVTERLLLTMLAGSLGVWLLGAVLNRLDLPGLDLALQWFPLAIVFTIFAVGGVVNSINIIDGYNGLAAGYTVIVLVALAIVAGQIGDLMIFLIALALASALLGFLQWNWPTGKIFLGDGGAYLIGFLLAEISILLIARNQNVSPWFPLLLLIYPVFETLFSIYRRKFVRGQSPGKADCLHLHTLIYLRVVSREMVSNKTERNSKVAKYLWGMATFVAIWGIIFYQRTSILIVGVALFCFLYLITYRQIVQWKIQHLVENTIPIKKFTDEKNRQLPVK